MTIDELIAKVDNEPVKTEPTTPQTQTEQTPNAQTEEDLLPIGSQFAEYCEAKKKK